MIPVGQIIVCGYGARGATTVEELVFSRHAPSSITIVDLDRERARIAVRLGVKAVVGDANRASTPRGAGLAKARSVVICLGTDASMLAAIRLAREVAPLATIAAAVSNPAVEELAYNAGAASVVVMRRLAGRLTIDSKLRGCDLVRVRIGDQLANEENKAERLCDYLFGQAADRCLDILLAG